MKKLVNNSWAPILENEFNKEYFKELERFVDSEYKNYKVYPDESLIFNAFSLCPIERIKVVIIGQDPYHNEGEAMGLAFSVNKGIKIPPSLKNIYKELYSDLGIEKDITNGDLTPWAEQGVLLLNAYLSVRAGIPLSHVRPEYDKFMDDVLKYVESLDQPIVYMLWGGFAKKYASKVTNPKHIVLSSVHPSPLSANRGGWFGQHLFSKCNAYLTESGTTPIDWQIK